MSKKMFRVEERGYFESGDSRIAVYDDGAFKGYKSYQEATDYVVGQGTDGDAYVERYSDGTESRVTVGKLRYDKRPLDISELF